MLAFCETVLWRSAFETRVGLLLRLHGTATLPMVMVSADFLRGCCVGAVAASTRQREVGFGLAVATRCWVTAEATYNSHALNGDGHSWLSMRMLRRGTPAAALKRRGENVLCLRLLGHSRLGATKFSLEPELVRETSESVPEQPQLVWLSVRLSCRGFCGRPKGLARMCCACGCSDTISWEQPMLV